MTKAYEKVQREVDVVHSLTCDICGRTVNAHLMSGEIWTNGETPELVRIFCHMSRKESFLFGKWEDVHDFDICPECFTGHIVPFVNSLKNGGVYE